RPDAAGERIRVMTTHGAKGLESPIVILPDTGDRRPPAANQIIISDDAPPLWRARSGLQTTAVSQVLTKQSEAQERERQRLLYVALTRAENWLIVCGAGEINETGNSWYRRVEAGMHRAGAVRANLATGPGLRLQHGKWPTRNLARPDTAGPDVKKLPRWTVEPPPSPAAQVTPLAPSGLGGAKSLPGEDNEADQAAAMRHGRQLHLLLEHLPNSAQASWPALARHLLTCRDPDVAPEEVARLLLQANALIKDPKLAQLFVAQAMCEVEITAEINQLDGARIRGAIDRLILSGDRVLAIDYKSNKIVPPVARDVPAGILRQMGAYLAALKSVYPGRKIDLSILWTADHTLMPLPHDIVMDALSAPPHLDDPQGRP
ncbi:MAG: 3'-5' exonuclease, partial [Paracoccaceae bacterium]